jgi:hypothetical protein
MSRKVIACVVLVAIISLAWIIVNFNTAPTKTKLNNIALCYHGITTKESEKSQYVTYFEDFKGQLNYIKSKGYTFVFPSQYNDCYTKKYSPCTPIATIMFDDARDSVTIATDWLIENKIPFSIAVIGRRLRTIEAEDGYLNWSILNRIVNTGYCEIMSHSYNMHNFGLYYDNNQVVSAPILEGPCYLDNGDFLYINEDDNRWYWDMSLVDDVSWPFPLFGTDVTTGKLISSTIEFKAKKNITANKLRVWTCLHLPNGSGYDVDVRIDINGTVVADTTLNVIEYKKHSQWPEREFVTLEFDKSYAIEENKTYSITFTTQNTGDSAFIIYSIPDFSGDFQLYTSCEGMIYGARDKWPAKACLIVAGDNGEQVSDKMFEQYVFDDLNMNNIVINKYLSATWTAHTTGFTENENLECVVLGGTYSDGSLGDTDFKYIPDTSFTCEVLRFMSASHLGEWYPLIIDIFINDTKIASFSPDWTDWSWQTVNIEPYEFIQGHDYNVTFKTINKSSSGSGLLRISTDQQDLPWPTWDPEDGSWIKPSDSLFLHDVRYKVNTMEGTDVFPDGININNPEYSWVNTAPFTGPGKPFLEFLSYNTGVYMKPKQLCYPFGSYYAENDKEDINPVLKNVLKSIGIETGFSVWYEDIGITQDNPIGYNEYIIPRYLVEGDIEQSQILKIIDFLMGGNNLESSATPIPPLWKQ